MSEPQHIAEILAQEWESCKHTTTSIRKVIISNGRVQLRVQCHKCGEFIGGAYSQNGIDLDTVALADMSLRESCRKQEAARARQVRETAARARHLEYENYIQNSYQWAEIRTKIMRRDSHWCQACLDATATDVHHRTYANLYEEFMYDLIAVCRECHKAIHGRI